MGNIEVWEGLPGSGRETSAMKESIELCHSGKRVLWVVDRRVHVQLIEEKALKMAGGAIAGFSAIAAGRLAWYLMEEAALNIPTVDVETRGLLLWEFLKKSETNKERSLSRGWEKIAVGAYQDIKAEVGSARIEQEKRLKTNYSWIWEAIETYDNLLGRERLLDESDLPGVAKRFLEEKEILPWDHVVINRLGPVSDPVLLLAETLAKTAPSTRIIVDNCSDEAPSLNLSKLDYHRWNKVEGITKRTFELNPINRNLAKHLFNSYSVSVAQPLKKVGISYNQNISDEVKYVGDKIASLVFEKKVELKDIAIVCADLEKYASYLEDFFPGFGLGVYHSLGRRMSSFPVTQIVLDIFKLKTKGFEPETVISVFKNPFVRGIGELNQASIKTLDVLRVLASVRWGLGDPEKTWIDPIENLSDKTLKRHDISRLEVNRLLKSFKDFVSLVNNTPSENMLDWYGAILFKMGVFDSLDEVVEKGSRFGVTNKQAYGHLSVLDKQIVSSSNLNGKIKTTQKKYFEALEHLVKNAYIKSAPGNHDDILVVGPLDLRGLKKKHVFFMGMSAGLWPISRTGGVLDPTAGSQKNEIMHMENKALTYDFLTSNENVYFTLPCLKGGEQEEKPSSMIREMELSGIEFMEDVYPQNNIRRTLSDVFSVYQKLEEKSRTELQQNIKETTTTKINWKYIDTTINIETLRQDPSVLSKYEGVLGKTPLNQHITEKILSNPADATGLDMYAKCPMQFFFQRVLGIYEEEILRDELEAYEKGLIAHDLMADINRELRAKGIGFADGGIETTHIIWKYAKKHIKEYYKDNLIAQVYIQSLAERRDEENGILEGAIVEMVYSYERAKQRNAVPVYIEASFGMDEEGEDSLSKEPVVIHLDGREIKLRGRIDLVAYDPALGYYLLDYKTGKKPVIKDIQHGISFQLPLYLIALGDILSHRGKGEEKLFGAAYFSLKNNSEAPYPMKKFDKEHDTVLTNILNIRKSQENGFYHQPLAQSSKLCVDGFGNYCPYKNICRKDHKLFEKRKDRLSAEQYDGAYLPPLLKELIVRREEAKNG